MKVLILVSLVGLAFCDFGQAQDIPFGDKVLPALFNGRVQTQLELSDNQKATINNLFKGIQERRKFYAQQLQDMSKSGAQKEEVSKKRQELIKELDIEKNKIQKEAFGVLLKHQVERLRQLTVQVMMQESAKQQKSKTGLLTNEMIEFLEIDEKQKEKILKKTEELQEKLLQQIKKLQDKYAAELLKELTASQRKKYTDAIGEQMKR